MTVGVFERGATLGYVALVLVAIHGARNSLAVRIEHASEGSMAGDNGHLGVPHSLGKIPVISLWRVSPSL